MTVIIHARKFTILPEYFVTNNLCVFIAILHLPWEDVHVHGIYERSFNANNVVADFRTAITMI